MRHFSLLIVLFLSSFLVKAQDTLMVEGIAPNMYLVHKVAPKENYYSVGRMYNVSPKELSAYNKLPFEKGLTLGQNIKVPLLPSNFVQSTQVAATEAVVPVYHTVQPKEILSKLSTMYKANPEDIKKWNHLKTSATTRGSNLVIGYLKVQKAQSALVNKSLNAVAVKEPSKDLTKPASTQPDNITKKDSVVTTVTTTTTTTPVANNTAGSKFNGGIFKTSYTEQPGKTEVKETGTAGIFKTSSGWQDGKFYCFHNGALPGSIVKITNTANGKTVFARVLDALPSIKQNNGLLLLVSNAAADELGATDKFDCSITYYK
jgi:LysM repeat protein